MKTGFQKRAHRLKLYLRCYQWFYPIHCLIAGLMTSLSLSGCTLFFGTVKPVQVRSADYKIMDLSKENRQWIQLNSNAPAPSKSNHNRPEDLNEPGDSEAGKSDLAYQEKKSGSVISASSACKNYKGALANEDLRILTQELLLGMSDRVILQERAITVASIPAWETIAKGTMNRENVMLKTIVLEKVNCVYDLILVAKPESFKRDEPVFSRFVSSLQFK